MGSLEKNLETLEATKQQIEKKLNELKSKTTKDLKKEANTARPLDAGKVNLTDDHIKIFIQALQEQLKEVNEAIKEISPEKEEDPYTLPQDSPYNLSKESSESGYIEVTTEDEEKYYTVPQDNAEKKVPQDDVEKKEETYDLPQKPTGPGYLKVAPSGKSSEEPSEEPFYLEPIPLKEQNKENLYSEVRIEGVPPPVPPRKPPVNSNSGGPESGGGLPRTKMERPRMLTPEEIENMKPPEGSPPKRPPKPKI